MNSKEPVLLTVLIETSGMRWRAGAIGLDHQVFPLLASQQNDLAGYRDLEFDQQASFLRHRFCGVLQRGCDRLWGVQKKACQFIFLTDQFFPYAPPVLTTRIAEHLVQWMANPPVVFYSADSGSWQTRPIAITPVAGVISSAYSDALHLGLPALLDAVNHPDRWEQVAPPKLNHP